MRCCRFLLQAFALRFRGTLCGELRPLLGLARLLSATDSSFLFSGGRALALLGELGLMLHLSEETSTTCHEKLLRTVQTDCRNLVTCKERVRRGPT